MLIRIIPLAIVLLSQLSFAEPKSTISNSFEKIPADEVETITGLIKTVGEENQTDVRDQHPKPYGCVDGATLEVNWDKPTVTLPTGEKRKLDIGAFAVKGRKFDVRARLSSGSNNRAASDVGGGPAGFALKLTLQNELKNLVIPFNSKTYGFKELFFLDRAEYYQTFDIITIAAGEDGDPVKEFFADVAKDYEDFFRFQKATKEKVAAIVIEAIKSGIKNPAADPDTVKKMGAAAQETLIKEYILKDKENPRVAAGEILKRINKTKGGNLLAREYHSMLPSLYGKDDDNKSQAVKYMLKPSVKPDEATLKVPEGVDVTKPNHLSDWLVAHLAARETKYDLYVQFHAKNFPSVEKSTAVWPEKDSPYVKIATLTIPKKAAKSEIIDKVLCETMSFNPGHAPGAHYPIGGSQRARVPVYVKDANDRNLKAERKPLNK